MLRHAALRCVMLRCAVLCCAIIWRWVLSLSMLQVCKAMNAHMPVIHAASANPFADQDEHGSTKMSMASS